MFVIIRERYFPKHTESSYFVGPDEGFSLMSTVAMQFDDDHLGDCLNCLHQLHKDIEHEILNSPNNCRKTVYYPQQLG